jgi:hypothetical protein
LERHFLRRVSFAAVLGAMLVAGCATVSGPVTPGADGSAAPAPAETPWRMQAPPTTSVNPATDVNLQGFPLPYRQGYADGCGSVGLVERKDAARFRTDGQYRTGWQDGFALCKKR